GKISAIDVDLLVNNLTPQNTVSLLEEVEQMVRRLRRSPETLHTLPSTQHAVIRALFDTAQNQELLKMLCNPLTYGIFLENFTANILLDNFIVNKDYVSGAMVASFLMLQEDFGSKLTRSLAVTAAYNWAMTQHDQIWPNYYIQKEEPLEEVKVRVSYVRNPYFDDHFDLRVPEHIVGKTLAWGAQNLEGSIRSSCELLGWALYQKWNKVSDLINDNKEPFAMCVVDKVKGLLIEAKEEESEEEKISRESILTKLNQVTTVELDIHTELMKLIEVSSKLTENYDIEEQKKLYTSWEEQRQIEVERQLHLYEKQRLMAEIEEKKKDLKEREEVIFFFDNEEKLEMMLPDKKKKYYPKKNSLKFGKKKPKKVDEGYIPPTVR
ncbi:unnamed protein product, partial [Meganyctiphanes norvegica]